jgi:hypothetical protein
MARAIAARLLLPQRTIAAKEFVDRSVNHG